MTFRPRRVEKSYKKFQRSNKPSGCVFCAFTPSHEQILRETDNFWISTNIFPYSIWENLTVQEHLMIVPKKHVESIGQFTAKQMKEYVDLVAEYDIDGYSTYTRSSSNVSKSVAHQHTHLLKLGDKRARVSLYIEKPYFLWFR